MHFGSSEWPLNLSFGNVHVNVNLTHAGTNSGNSGLRVSGVDLKLLDQQAVRLNGEYTIQGTKVRPVFILYYR